MILCCWQPLYFRMLKEALLNLLHSLLQVQQCWHSCIVNKLGSGVQMSLHVSAVYFPKTILAYYTVLVGFVCPSVLYKARLPRTLDLNMVGHL